MHLKITRTSPVFLDGTVCISILHDPGEDKYGYEDARERWSPVHSIRVRKHGGARAAPTALSDPRPCPVTRLLTSDTDNPAVRHFDAFQPE